MKITEDVARRLKSYVYVYIDPRDDLPFYIGKGKGNRIFTHLADIGDHKKVQRIKEIREAGHEPQIDILRYGLSDGEASLVEAAAIDLITKAKLTNRVAGYHKGSFARITSKDLIIQFTARPVKVRHPGILITINKLYRSDMTALELYEATRGIWKIGPRRDQAEYAFAVYQGIVREVFQIARWDEAGTSPYYTRDDSAFAGSGRWEFTGKVANAIRDQYLNRSVGRGNQNPIRYVNI